MTKEAINELKKYTLGKKNTEKVEISVLQLNRVIKALEQEPKWIPVSERFPEEYKTVIASTKYDGVYPEARYTEECGWEWAYESGADYWEEIKDDVEAWMPLPKRYKPQAESEE